MINDPGPLDEYLYMHIYIHSIYMYVQVVNAKLLNDSSRLRFVSPALGVPHTEAIAMGCCRRDLPKPAARAYSYHNRASGKAG